MFDAGVGDAEAFNVVVKGILHSDIQPQKQHLHNFRRVVNLDMLQFKRDFSALTKLSI